MKRILILLRLMLCGQKGLLNLAYSTVIYVDSLRGVGHLYITCYHVGLIFIMGLLTLGMSEHDVTIDVD